MTNIKENIEQIREMIRMACEKTKRNQSEVKIIGISKGFDAMAIKEAHLNNISDFGENYLQESLPKQEALKNLPLKWHYTGHLQRNKAATVTKHFDLIHSVDSLRLIEALDQCGKTLNSQIPILLQFKCGHHSAYGFTKNELFDIPSLLPKFQFVDVRGLMSMAPPSASKEESRPFFHETRGIFLNLKNKFDKNFIDLSMGMSGDFETAVEEGATLVRIGRAIFGERQYKR